MANGHGGARANSGRKAQATETYRGTIRALFETRGTAEQWQKVIDVAFARAASGDDAARKWVSDWCIGKVPDVVEATHHHDGSIEHLVALSDEELRALISRARG